MRNNKIRKIFDSVIFSVSIWLFLINKKITQKRAENYYLNDL